MVAIPVVVFNYLKSDAQVDVTLENIGEFEFADYSNDVEAPPPSNEKSPNLEFLGVAIENFTNFRNFSQVWNCTGDEKSPLTPAAGKLSLF